MSTSYCIPLGGRCTVACFLVFVLALGCACDEALNPYGYALDYSFQEQIFAARLLADLDGEASSRTAALAAAAHRPRSPAAASAPRLMQQR